MPITSAAGLVEAVRRFGLLAAPQAEELVGLQPRFTDARALAKELLQRGWLTPYQINHLVAENGSSLVLGQYVLLERIGEGGMGQVLKARHQRLERIVALKLIRKERLIGRDAVQRFQREARAAARLSHPNLVTVFDADEVGGTHFYAMEYVEGTDLAKLVRKQGMLPIREACEYVSQAALGLQHAHEQGLVHRDIKPANVMLTTKGVVKVLDLGLARLATPEGSDPTDPMTHEGAVMGTPDYMAPEQATDSHTADIRADLYSLGCTLFHLLTGKVPYPGGTLTEKLLKHQMDPIPRPEVVRTDMPPELVAVVRKLLAKKPAERFPTPAELATALEPFCGNRLPIAIPVGETIAYTPGDQSPLNTQTDALTVDRPKPVAIPATTVALAATKGWWKKGLSGGRRLARAARRKPWLAVGAGVGLVLLLLVLFIRPGRHRGEDGGEPSSNGEPGPGGKTDLQWIAGMKREPLQWEKYQEPLPREVVGVLGDLWGRHWGAIRCTAYSPDGSLAASGGDDKLIRIWDAKTLEPRGILKGHTFPVAVVAFSPDGKKLASCSQEQDWRVWLWDLETKKYSKLVGHGNVVTQLAFSTDGKWLLSAGRDQVAIQWDLSSEHFRRLDLDRRVRCVALSPDGRHALSGHSDKTMRLWDFEKGGEERRFEGHTDGVDRVAFSPDGSRAVSNSDGDNTVRLWDVKSGKELQHRGELGGYTSSFAFTPNSRRIVLGKSDAISLIDAYTLGLVKYSHKGVRGQAFAPDSTRALSWYDHVTLCEWDLETEQIIRYPYGHGAAVSSVAFTPDGRYLLSGSLDSNVTLWDLESKKSVGGYPHSAPISCVAVSPNGRYAFFGAVSDGKTQMGFWEIEARRLVAGLVAYSNGGPTSVAFSPDSRLALSGGICDYPGSKAPNLKLWDVDKCIEVPPAFEGSNETIWSVAFSPDGKQAISGGVLKTIRLWDVATGKQVRSLAGHTDTIRSVAFAPDGRHILSGGENSSVRLWDLQEDQPKGRLLEGGPKGVVSCVTVAPDGKTYAASGQDGRITVWKASGERLWSTQLPGAVNGIAYAPDSRHLATANANGTIFILRLPE